MTNNNLSSLIMGLLQAGAVIWALITVVKITVALVINWFKNRRKIKLQDKENIAFTLKGEMEKGNYVVYQGIFDPVEDEILDGQKLTGKEMDEELMKQHSDSPLVIYT